MAELGEHACVLDLVVAVSAVRTGEGDNEHVFEEGDVREHHAGLAAFLTVDANTFDHDRCVTLGYAPGTSC